MSNNDNNKDMKKVVERLEEENAKLKKELAKYKTQIAEKERVIIFLCLSSDEEIDEE